ncbi:outer membrane protein assembly complex, YaeT protein [Desulfobulbus propionicus DSM 2032]|uniref:Outer membrane protein assembly factor BamA n=1 Tax=Desulfobulbus propionicus (strain ATCC 33891 / DSM 2032 / VKM B-1956 / 1pr3) TaxID=577650 RepID=A0A7U4DNB7_DESPD|nr:outer membrane protein assembly complex, YaeT protein [Desulfobulbus propionicus DSM 2032]
MQSTSRIQPPPLSFSLLFCVLLSGLFAWQPGVCLALERNTVFLPFKINAPDAANVAGAADRVLSQEAMAKGMKMVPRAQAEKLVDYSGPWPPAASVLTKVAESAGTDYVVVGSLNKLGNRISVDCAIVDVLTPQAPYSAFREADSLEGLEKVTGEVVGTMLAYSNRGATVASITPEGNERIDAGAILQKISTKPGDLYDPTTLREDLKAVFAMGYFDNVEIEAKESEGGKNVVFRVKEKPLIGSVVIVGAEEIKEEDVRDAASITANAILNPAKVNEAVQKIKELYKSKGYYNTEVGAKISYPADANAEVRFDIQEGEKITIEKIAFTGNTSFDEDELEDAIQTGTHSWWHSWLTDAGVLKMEVLKQDAERISTFYQNQGFLEAKVGEPIVEQKDDELYVTFPIEEGPRYQVGTVDIEGDLIKSKEELVDLLKIREEEYLNRQVLRDDVTRLTDLYAEQGYAFAEINPKVNKSDAAKRVDVLLHVDKGAMAYINRVEIQGNTRTRDNVIRRDLKVQEGGRFDSKAIRTSTQKLNRLGFFEEVNVTPKPTLIENQMDILVDVKEKSTGQFSIGAGYSSSENVLFMGEISEDNIFGTGNKLSLAASTSSKSTKYNMNFTNPRLYDSQVSGSIDLFNWEREYDDFTKDSTGSTLRLGHPLFEEWRIYYGYTISDTDITDIDDDVSEYIKRSADIHLTSMAELSLVRDTRDKIFSPTKGSRNSISVDYAGGPLGGDAQFTKVEGASSWYFPLFWSTVFHVKGAAGQAFENEDGKLPVYEHFFLGGMNSIRGFDSASISPRDPKTDDKIGGDKMWYGTVSIIFPLVKDLGMDGEIFHDFGNVYDVDDNWDFSDYKKTAGVGILWASPLGPLRLAWGFNLDKQDDEDSSNWDFSMGGTF